MAKEIALSKGKVAIVDDADYEYLSQWKWYAKNCGTVWYAMRGQRVGKRTKQLSMHRILLDPADDIMVDHVNLDGLDNRRENLRTCTKAENMRNDGIRVNSKSGFKGVHWDKNRQRWVAYITTDGKRKHLGRFDNIEQAVRAYDVAARELHGEFARLNSPEGC